MSRGPGVWLCTLRPLAAAVTPLTVPAPRMCRAGQTAFTMVQASANHINEAIRARENREKIAAIQRSAGVKTLIKPSREFRREAVLSKMCRRGLKSFTFYLFNDLLFYTGDSGMLGKPSHREIPLEACRVTYVRTCVSPWGCEPV